MTRTAQTERKPYPTVKACMGKIFSVLALMLAATVAPVYAATTLPEASEPTRIVIRQDATPLANPLPAIAKRDVAPKTDMRTVLRCRDGVCVSVSTKTRLGATAPTTD